MQEGEQEQQQEQQAQVQQVEPQQRRTLPPQLKEKMLALQVSKVGACISLMCAVLCWLTLMLALLYTTQEQRKRSHETDEAEREAKKHKGQRSSSAGPSNRPLVPIILDKFSKMVDAIKDLVDYATGE